MERSLRSRRSHQWARQALAACFAVTLLLAPAAESQTPARLVAVGDVHGAYPQFVALLQSARLIDSQLKWIGGSAVLVQTGDVIDRGAQSRASLDLLMALETQAPKKGGAVIPLLGNHEVMNVIGQLAYVTPEIYKSFASGDSEKRRQKAYEEYLKFLTAHGGHNHSAILPGPRDDAAERAKWMEEHPVGFVEHRDAFGPKGKYGKWLRTRHSVVQIGGGVFLHGGLNAAFGIPGIREVDERITTELAVFDTMWQMLVDAKLIWRYMTLAEAVTFAGDEAAWLKTSGQAAPPAVSAAGQRLLDFNKWMVSTFAEGPLWDRELAEAPEETLIESLTAMMARLRIQYIVVGHTPQSNGEIASRFGSRVFLIDTGMLTEVYQGRATALEIQNGHFAALSVDRPAAELAVPPKE